jgi:preprotein translocase subunit YajC
VPAFDITTIGLLAVAAVLIFFMFRNSRKRKVQQAELQNLMVPGAEVMTNFGLYGKLTAIDEAAKIAEIEVSPGNVVRVHSQTLAKVVDPDAPRSVEEAQARAEAELAEIEAAEQAAAAPELNADNAIPLDDPEFGERVDPKKRPKKSGE